MFGKKKIELEQVCEKPDAYICKNCGEFIGYIGRFFLKIGISAHKCNNSNNKYYMNNKKMGIYRVKVSYEIEMDVPASNKDSAENYVHKNFFGELSNKAELLDSEVYELDEEDIN